MFVILLIPMPSAWSGNPIVLPSGAVLRWPTMELTYHLDRGALGPYSEKFIQQLVIKAFTAWNQIPSSALHWKWGGLLDTDGTLDGAMAYVGVPDDGINPVLFDTSGRLIDLLSGEGASDYLLGLATPYYLTNGTIQEAEIIINGKGLHGRSLEAQRLYATLLHEIGHLCGVGHTQLLTDFAFDTDRGNNLFIPVMFPVEPVDQISSNSLSQDDMSTLSALYPRPDFMQERGGITGTVQRPWGDPVQGANVVAVNVNEPLVSVYATVSDLEINQTGEFRFLGLTPGPYEIYMEPIKPMFKGTAGVGPFSSSETAPSFNNPVKWEYYNGDRESGFINRDNPEERVQVMVGKGEIVTGIDLVSNEEVDTPVQEWSVY